MPKRPSYDFWILTALLFCCLGLRIGVVTVRFQELLLDPDSYIGIAQNLSSGRGYSIPGTTNPTAFRPPLYPLLIALISQENFAWARAGLNLLAAAGSLLCIWQTATNLQLSRFHRCLAVLIYGCDPLLLRYSSLSMTETVCSLMSALLLWRITSSQRSPSQISVRLKPYWQAGLVFGFCVLTRPSFWVFGILYCGIVLRNCMSRQPSLFSPSVRQFAISVAGLSLVVSPWLIRNVLVLGSPVLMTTHGGYTILLGNNDAFYSEVVNQPLGTIWDGSKGAGQAAWAQAVNQRMDKLGLTTEVERDRWMANLAKQTIRENPGLFLKACVLRFIRFWNIVPSGPAAEGFPPLLLKLVGSYYLVLGLFFCIGLYRLLRIESLFNSLWTPVLLLVFSFTLVHLIYWSNVRMRAPIVPAIALIASAAWPPKRINESTRLELSESLQSP